MTSGSAPEGLLAGAPSLRLANDALMPLLGLGVWRVPAGETEQAVLWALEAGYRHVDTAAAYGTDLLRRTVERAEVPPMVNQVEWHPQVWSPSELRAHRDLGVVLESYSPLGHGRLLRDPAIAEIAGRVGRTPAQVLVRWCLQHGVPTIPKSRSRERIVENAQVLDWALGEEDMARLDALRGG